MAPTVVQVVRLHLGVRSDAYGVARNKGDDMSDYELHDNLFARHIVQPGDPVTGDMPYEPYDSVRPKFESVAAAIMWYWSMDSSQDEDCGDAQYGNGWHALFRSERAILHTDNSGFVSAWRVQDELNIGALWEAIEKGAVYDY
jgi:hypothetical protein